MTVTQVSYPVAPTTTPLNGTLLSAATVQEGMNWLDGRALFDSYNCMKFQAEAEWCAPNNKNFDQAAVWQEGFRFAAYGGVSCKAVGLDQGRMQSEVERVFKAGESTAVERALMKQRFVAETVDDLWDAPTDITPGGTAVSPAVGLALLEGFAADSYVGSPTIHIPVTIASLLSGNERIKVDGDRMWTRLGSKVAAGAGYDYPNTSPTGAAAAAGERWLYATGEVFVARSEAVIRQVIAQEDNDVFVLAERGYIAAVDCFAAAVKVTVQA